MNASGAVKATQKIRVILPVILRITFSLALWTLGAMTMTLLEDRIGKQNVSHGTPALEIRHEFH